MPHIMHSPGFLSVLLYESSASIVANYVHDLEAIFRDAGYPARIRAIVPGSTGETADRADILDTDYFDAVISDISMGGSGGNDDGLQALHRIKSRIPDLLCIAYSGMQDITYSRYSNRLRFDFYIDKTKLSHRGYVKEVTAALRERINVNIHAYITDDSLAECSGLSSAEIIQLSRIVRKITYTDPSSDESLQISQVRLKRIYGGYSGATTLYMQASTARGLDCMQAVLKLARTSDRDAAASIEHEARNYRQLVKWYLPYYWRPEMLGESHGGPLSAICYAFVSSQGAPLQNLGELIRTQRAVKAADKVVAGIFNPKNQRWYHARNVRQEQDLHKFYMSKCFDDADITPYGNAFRYAMRQFDTSNASYIQIDAGTRCPEPVWSLFGRPAGRYLSCLIHGDLNTNNIFVASGARSNELKFVDFSAAGRGHVFYDFIVFEVSVRLDQIHHSFGSTLELIRQERLINAGERSPLPYSELVLKLRAHAWNNFPDELKNNYLFGIAGFCLSMLTFKELSDEQRRVLASCITAAMLDLEAAGFWKEAVNFEQPSLRSQHDTYAPP